MMRYLLAVRNLLLIAAALSMSSAVAAEPKPLAVVSAADFGAHLAPGSIGTIFGNDLAATTVLAALDETGQLPTDLDNVSIDIDGNAAGLIFTSANQINFYIDSTVPLGPATLTVHHNGESGSIEIEIDAVAPGLFLLSCVRFDRGTVQEGIDLTLESFKSINEGNPGEDKRTRLTLWGTGIRFASADGQSNGAAMVSVEAVDRTGRVVQLHVEYAGPTSSFFGLDQINVIIPAHMANAGFVELRVRIGESESNRVSVLLLEDAPDMHEYREVVTEAGNGLAVSAGDNGAAVDASFVKPVATALDRQGNLYIADEDARMIRMVSPDGTISTFAGTGDLDGDGDGGPAVDASFRRPVALAVDRDGSLLVADADDHRVRRIARDGNIYPFAGTGLAGDSGDLGLATAARVGTPVSIAFNKHGSLLIADVQFDRVRKVYGDGYIAAFAGTGDPGNLGDGGLATEAMLAAPTSVAVGLDQSVLIADTGNRRIRRVDPLGVIRTISGTGEEGIAESGIPFAGAPLSLGLQLATDPNGRVCITDSESNQIRTTGSSCQLFTIAGSGEQGMSPSWTPALVADLNNPSGPAFGPTNEIYFTSPESRIVRRLARVVRDEGGACIQELQVVIDRGALMPEEPLFGYVRFNCSVEEDTVVVLSSDHSRVLIPASVTVAAGEQLAFFECGNRHIRRYRTD